MSVQNFKLLMRSNKHSRNIFQQLRTMSKHWFSVNLAFAPQHYSSGNFRYVKLVLNTVATEASSCFVLINGKVIVSNLNSNVFFGLFRNSPLLFYSETYQIIEQT